MVNDHLPTFWGTLLATVISLMTMSPFLWGLSMKRVKRDLLDQLKREDRGNQMPLIIMIIFRIILGVGFVAYFLSGIYSQRLGIIIVVSVFILLFIIFSKKVQRQVSRMEDMFMNNLNERELRRTGKKNSLIRNMHLAHMEVSGDCKFVGKRLRDANIRKEYGVNVVSIKRGNKRMNIPDGESRIFPGDVVSVIGTDDQIQKFLTVVEPPVPEDEPEAESVKVSFESFAIASDSYLIGKTVSESGIRDKESCLLVGIERKDGTFIQPTGQTVFEAGDLLWIVGEDAKIDKIMNGPDLAD